MYSTPLAATMTAMKILYTLGFVSTTVLPLRGTTALAVVAAVAIMKHVALGPLT